MQLDSVLSNNVGSSFVLLQGEQSSAVRFGFNDPIDERRLC